VPCESDLSDESLPCERKLPSVCRQGAKCRGLLFLDCRRLGSVGSNEGKETSRRCECNISLGMIPIGIVALFGLNILGVDGDQLPIAQQLFSIIGRGRDGKQCTQRKQ